MRALAPFWLGLLLSSGCVVRELAELPPRPEVEELTDIAVDLNRDFDILFVIDSSKSMAGEQDSLRANFPRIIDALDFPGLGLPSLHIGVITTDVGAGDNCPGDGDAGNMIQVGPNGCGGPRDPYISDVADDSGGRIVNYDGTLGDTFSCIANVGIKGCGFEQPLESIRLALADNPRNAGFLREHAYLAIVVISDEDDCSAADAGLFARTSPDLDEPGIGPNTSFRCFEFGVECEGDDPRQPGAKRDCVPRVDSAYMHPVGRYTEFLQQLKPFPQQLVLATIAGPLAPVEVAVGFDSTLNQDAAELVKSCDTGRGEAVPPIRLHEALAATGSRLSETTICDEDLTESVAQLADYFVDIVVPCVRGDLYDVDPSTDALEPECTVTELSIDTTGDEVQRALPRCDDPGAPDSSSNLPCYTMLPDDDCVANPTGLALAIHYPAGYTPPPLTRARAACRGR